MTALRTLAFAALTFAMTGCAHKVNVSYLEAARIDVDQDIRTVLVIDRSRARGAEHVLSAAEGAATGETYMLDADSAAIALEALEDVLDDGQRFEVVSFHVDGRAVDTSIWDREMAARKVRQLCRQAHCDAVIALDAFDSDTTTAVKPRKDEKDVDFQATQDTDVVATFRMYDGDTGRVIDESRVTAGSSAASSTRDTPVQALNDLPYEAAVFDGAAALGAGYGARISPHTVVDSRTLYSGGSDVMRKAHRAAKRGDLQRAVDLWAAEANSGDPGVRAKALYNLAVAAEADGNLRRAARLARDASLAGGKKRMRTYVAVLEDRQDNASRVRSQLGRSVARR
ncbi:MAG: hypothetical protein H6736_04625 [Alphaproteobacteria bacterium]|nr:hypothetical protein [Alphaproteobacteria bacterium]MCB9691081.1 hypothetical protein [Alphaproteobacteria bacterium]